MVGEDEKRHSGFEGHFAGGAAFEKEFPEAGLVGYHDE